MNILTNDTWQNLGFTGLKKRNGNESHTCPKCSHTRKKSKFKCVTVNHDTGWANCHHCDAVFKLGTSKREYQKTDFIPASHTFGEKVYEKPKMPLPSEENIEKFYKYFAARGISKETLQAMQVAKVNTFLQGNSIEIKGKTITTKDGLQSATMFPYFRNNELINAKYRSAAKAFRLEKGCELILYNFDVLYTDIKTLIITEGEIDCLSFLECGITNVVSVPNGASEKPNLSYIDNAIELLNDIDTFIIATDNDKAGELLADALTRKLGREKCKRVLYPEGCKDCNDVLVKFGKEAVQSIIEKSIVLNIKGIVPSINLKRDVAALYNLGKPTVYGCGIVSVDEHFKVRLSEYSIISGRPNQGKSTFAEDYLQRLNFYNDLKCAYLSFENTHDYMSANMLERAYGKTFFEPNEFQLLKKMQRMTFEEMEKGMDYIDDNFKFFDCRGIDENGDDLEEYSIDVIVEKAKSVVKQFGVKVLFVDPFNYIDVSKKPKSFATAGEYNTYINKTLSSLAKKLDVAVFLVAHPTQNVTGRYEYVDLNGVTQIHLVGDVNNIAGSASFGAIADNIIIIDTHPVTGQMIFITRKIKKQQFVGKRGSCLLDFDINTQQLKDSHYHTKMPNYRSKIFKTQKQDDTRTKELLANGFNQYKDG